MVASCKTVLVKINPQTIPVEYGMTINPKPIFVNTLALEVLAILTKVWTIFILVEGTLKLYYHFFDSRFSSLK